MLAGGRLGNALAERGGTHAQDLKTRVMRDGGRTCDSTAASTTAPARSPRAGSAVSALDDDDRLVLAFVPAETAGVTFDHDWNVMGQRATVSGGARFEDVEVDPSW